MTNTISIDIMILEALLHIISDISGKTSISKTVALHKGAQTIAVDISQLAPGMYLVNLDQNGKSQTQKLVVTKS